MSNQHQPTSEQLGKMIRILIDAGYMVMKAPATPFIAPPAAAKSAPVTTPPAVTADGRKGYTCGVCHQPGHNARKCPTTARPAPAPVAAKPAAAPVAAPVQSMDLGGLDFDIGDLTGAAPVVQPAPKAPKAAAAPVAAPTPDPTEATDGEVNTLAADLADLDALFP